MSSKSVLQEIIKGVAWREMIPDENWNLQEGMKSFRNGKYLVNVKTISLLISLKYI